MIEAGGACGELGELALPVLSEFAVLVGVVAEHAALASGDAGT